jgi:ribosomal protein S15P/S13E
MKESKKYQLQDLIEKIDKVDEMIRLHSKNPSKFMLEQYEAKKEKLLSYLIDELVDSKMRSPYSFKLVFMALQKYYPALMTENFVKKADGSSKELKELEAVLAA